MDPVWTASRVRFWRRVAWINVLAYGTMALVLGATAFWPAVVVPWLRWAMVFATLLVLRAGAQEALYAFRRARAYAEGRWPWD